MGGEFSGRSAARILGTPQLPWINRLTLLLNAWREHDSPFTPKQRWNLIAVALSGLFDQTFYLEKNPDVAADGKNPLLHYILNGAREGRSPHPGFDGRFYRMLYAADIPKLTPAFVHFVRFGAAKGNLPNGKVSAAALSAAGLELRHPIVDIMPWQLAPLEPATTSPPYAGRVGIFIHMYYEELAEEFATILANFPYAYHVYISTSDEAKKQVIETTFSALGHRDFSIKVLPNIGRDMAPFVLGFTDEIDRHEICLRLHSKKSTHKCDDFGSDWRRHLCKELLGDHERVKLAVQTLATHSNLGVLMPCHWPRVASLISIGANWREMTKLLDRLDMSILPSQTIDYPSGSMFWFRNTALKPLFSAGLNWDDFSQCNEENRDATIAHGIERIVLFCAVKAKLGWAILPPFPKAGRLDEGSKATSPSGPHPDH